MMITLRSALYKVKELDDEEVKGDVEYDDVDWEGFTKSRLGEGNEQCDHDCNVEAEIPDPKINRNNTLQSLSDEEHGVAAHSFDDINGSALSPAEISNHSSIDTNESSIDTNEYYDDDGVNSFNSELEPLTPSPSNMKKARKTHPSSPPRIFSFNQRMEMSPKAEPSAPPFQSASPEMRSGSPRPIKIKSSQKDTKRMHRRL